MPKAVISFPEQEMQLIDAASKLTYRTRCSFVLAASVLEAQRVLSQINEETEATPNANDIKS